MSLRLTPIAKRSVSACCADSKCVACNVMSDNMNQKEQTVTTKCVSREWGCASINGEEVFVCRADEGNAHGGVQSGTEEANDDQEKTADPQAGRDGDPNDDQANASANNGDRSNANGVTSADDMNVVVSAEPDSASPPPAASSAVLIAAIAGGVLALALCVVCGVVVFCVVAAKQTTERPITVSNNAADSRYSSVAGEKKYGQSLSRDAQMRNDFAQGNVVRTGPDTKIYVDTLSRESEEANRNPARYANEVHTMPQKLYVDKLSKEAERANDESKRYANV